MTKYIVQVHALNIREAPSINYPSIGLLSKGDVVDAYEISGDGKWIGFNRITGNEKQKGWASMKFLLSLENGNLIKKNDFPWFKIAISEMGVREFYGAADNPRIIQYLKSTEHLSNQYKSNDETPWCAAFVNWCIEQSGIEGMNSAWARHWLNWGEKIDKPVRGCVVILKREAAGHVGFFMKETSTTIHILGGNQDDEVNIKSYPKKFLLGYRLIPIAG